jgi:cytochrome c556
MRTLMVLLLGGVLLAQEPAPPPAPKAVGTMSELMIDVVYPTSNAVFYIFREPPKNDVQWDEFKTQALTLAESANLLMMPSRARDQEKWMADAKLLWEVGNKAYRAAQAKNLDAIVALNDELNTACVQCHMDYRPAYGRRSTGAAKQQK